MTALPLDFYENIKYCIMCYSELQFLTTDWLKKLKRASFFAHLLFNVTSFWFFFFFFSLRTPEKLLSSNEHLSSQLVSAHFEMNSFWLLLLGSVSSLMHHQLKIGLVVAATAYKTTKDSGLDAMELSNLHNQTHTMVHVLNSIIH